jgi:NAD(P)-dependent dehydrogenase (short-subunit alcohol dehydrogenase family)
LPTAHAGVTVHISVADISDECAVNKAFEDIGKALGKVLGKVNVLVSNAGYLPDTNPIAETDVEEWFRRMTLNFKGSLIPFKSFPQVRPPRT